MSDNNQGFDRVEPISSERVTRFAAPQQVTEAGKQYRAVISTNKGDITVDLFADSAPVTVNSFVFLALNRYYDGIVFHRVLEDFMAQTGDPTGTGRGGPGYTFADELGPKRRHHGPGVLSMANAGPGTNGSQFFITFIPTPWLDGKHTVFGEVVSGSEVLDKIHRIDPSRGGGGNPDWIESVSVYVKN